MLDHLTTTRMNLCSVFSMLLKHMTELVENMLDLAKMDLGAEPKHEALDVSHCSGK